ncbi:zinc finger, CCHC-type containing protein [Tanacetum coccineum]
MGDKNPIRTLGDYFKPSHEGYRNTIELPAGNNVLEIGLNVFQQDPSPHGRILLPDSLLSSFLPGRTAKLRSDILIFQQRHGESLSEAWTRFKDLLQKVPHHGIDLWLQVQIFYDHVNPVTRRTIDQSAGGKLRDLNTKESWALLEDLALYDNESWNDPRDFAKPVKAITLPQDVSSTSDSRLIKLKNQVQHLMEAHLAPTQHTQCEIDHAADDKLRNKNTDKSWEIIENLALSDHEGWDETKEFIKPQREKINGRMTEIFGLLKELATSRTPEKVLIREETKFFITKNVNSISLTRNEEEENNKMDETPDNTKMPTETEMPVRKTEAMNRAENGAGNESIITPENDEAVKASGSQPVSYYLKHKINEKLIKGLVKNNKFNNSRSRTLVGKKKEKEYKILPRGPAYEAILKKKITKKEDIRGNFKIPCGIGDLKHVNVLVDQGSDVNVMPYSTNMRLTDERPAETDIRLSLASYSYIYPLGIAEDVLVEVVEHIFLVDFVILDIKENKKRPFIFGKPFLTIAKATIKFDISTINLRSGKSKISFHRISDSSCITDRGVKNDIEPIAPIMIVNSIFFLVGLGLGVATFLSFEDFFFEGDSSDEMAKSDFFWLFLEIEVQLPKQLHNKSCRQQCLAGLDSSLLEEGLLHIIECLHV